MKNFINENARFCSQCGAPIADEEKFCTNCGYGIQELFKKVETKSFSEKILTKKIYSEKAILFGTFLGGPLVAGIFMSKNYKVLGNEKYSKIALLLGVIITVLTILLIQVLTESNSAKISYFIEFIIIGTTSLVFHRLQKPYVDAFLQAGGEKESGWKIFGISLLSLITYLGILFLVYSAKNPLWIESDDGISEYNKGVEYQETNQLSLAEQQFKLAIQKKPNLAEAYLNLGLIYINDGWLEGGEEMTLKSISIFKSTNVTIVVGSTLQQSLSTAYNNLGVIEIQRAAKFETNYNYSSAKNHWEKGMQYFYEAVRLDPMNSKAQSNINKFSNAY